MIARLKPSYLFCFHRYTGFLDKPFIFINLLAYDIVSHYFAFVFNNILGSPFIFDVFWCLGPSLDFHGQIVNPPRVSQA